MDATVTFSESLVINGEEIYSTPSVAHAASGMMLLRDDGEVLSPVFSGTSPLLKQESTADQGAPSTTTCPVHLTSDLHP